MSRNSQDPQRSRTGSLTTLLLTGSYSARGTLASVQGSYGTILARNVADADGAPLLQVYGDAAETTEFRCYNPLRQLTRLGVYRNAALPSCASDPFFPTSTAATTAQTLLLDDQFVPTASGNPTTIADGRIASEWGPGGAAPVASRVIQYDDSDRITQVNYTYSTASGADSYTSPTLPATPYQSPLAPIASAPQRVRQQGFTYDWLGNTTGTSDDAIYTLNVACPSLQTVRTASRGRRRRGTPSSPAARRQGHTPM